MRRLALPVRLAHMVARPRRPAQARRRRDACGADHRARAWRRQRRSRTAAVAVCGGTIAARHGRRGSLAERLAQARPDGKRRIAWHPRRRASAGALLIHAWPDRVAKARGERGRFVLSNGARRDARRRRSAGRREIPRRRRSAGQGAERPHRLGRRGLAKPTSARRSASASRRRKETLFDLEKARGAGARNRAARRDRACRAPAAGAVGRGRRSRDPRRAARSTGLRCCRGARKPRRCGSGWAGCIAGSARPGPMCRTRR